MASDPSQFAKSVAAEMSKLQSDGSRDSLQQLKGVQQGIKADARAVLVDQKAGVALAQEQARRETALIKERERGVSVVAAAKAKADVEADARAKERQEKRQEALSRKVDAATKKTERESAAAEKARVKQSVEMNDAMSDGLKGGASYLLKASEAMVVAAAAVTVAGVQYGIHVSSAKRDQEEALRNLTKNYGGEKRGVEQGDVAFRVTMSLAGEKGVDPKTALERVRGLIDSKFERGDTELYFRLAADVDAVKGGGAGDALLGQIETLKRLDAKLKDQRGRRDVKASMLEKGNAQATALDQLSMSGVKTSEVLQLLANKGEGMKSVSMRLRRGKIDMDDFLHATAKVAGKGMEGVAGRGLDAGLNRAKIGIDNLFSDFDLSPIDELSAKLDSALKSEGGAELKAGIKDVGQAFIDLTKDVSKDDIKGFFSDASSAAHDLASGIRDARDMAKDLGEFGKTAVEWLGAIPGFRSGLDMLPGGDRAAKDANGGKREMAEAEGQSTGKALMDGMAKGIADYANEPANAASMAVAGTIAAGDAKAEIHSPSRVGVKSGKYYDEGWALGIKQNADKPAQAAAGMVGGIAGAGATAGGFGGSGASTGDGGGGNTYVFSPNIVLPAGSSSSAGAAVNSALAAAYPVWLSWARQRDRDQQETRGRV